jgi:hypothetical protein
MKPEHAVVVALDLNVNGVALQLEGRTVRKLEAHHIRLRPALGSLVGDRIELAHAGAEVVGGRRLVEEISHPALLAIRRLEKETASERGKVVVRDSAEVRLTDVVL